MTRLFSHRARPVHLGGYALERLARGPMPDLSAVTPFTPLTFRRDGSSLVNAMADHQAMMDAIRDGLVNRAQADIPRDPRERANHLKAFGYFSDAAMVGTGLLPDAARLDAPVVNPGIATLADALRTRQTKTLASGIDMIMADLKDSMEAPPSSIQGHSHVLVFLYDHPRDPGTDEPGCDWIQDMQAERACLRATETAVVIANYIRLLGWDAKAHSSTCTDLDLNRLAVATGLVDSQLAAPWLGHHYGVAAVSTTLDIAADKPLSTHQDPLLMEGPGWRLGTLSPVTRSTRDPFARRLYRDGPHAFETLKRVTQPTTYMDEANIPRVPKRTDMFARAQFGDLGKKVQQGATGGHYARKSAPSMAQRRMLGAFVLLQDGTPKGTHPWPADPRRNADLVKAGSYYLGVDAVGISRCPDWAWYSHDATGARIDPPHPNAISMIIDQGFETMEGASGDDWISVAQSMRAYLRFSLLGGVIAAQIRSLGYSAKTHTVLDGDVLQPPLLLLSGLGEVSRIGEVILNPMLGPRLKSGVVTTDMPLAYDDPIDFGLQRFCESCNKCARECPSGAITAGPKTMFNGYEIWKSDSQKCATYRITTEGGAMCGRCMKTCPWNLQGLFAEGPFRKAAMTLPMAAPWLARLDDKVGRGGLNPAKKWWWDIELDEDGAYRAARAPVNRRDLQPDLIVRPEDQTLAVYPAPLAPHPWPYPFPMDREKGIEAWQAMISADEYRQRRAAGDGTIFHKYDLSTDSPVLRVKVSLVEQMADEITKYEFQALDGHDLPQWEAGSHLDIVVAPEFLRQFSLSGNPADRSRYQIAVLREDGGRGGSRLLHRIFAEGRKVFVSKPINHFPLVETAPFTLLMGGGIGVTPLIAMAHRLHALGSNFALHYSVHSRSSAGFLQDLAQVPWKDHVHLHISDEGKRADLTAMLENIPGTHVYTCGPDAYMQAVLAEAEAAGFPDDHVHSEYFAPPETADYVNHPFTLCLKDGREIAVTAEETAAEALIRSGLHVDLKCDDGICGVCQCGVLDGAVEHRDFVLSKAQRKDRMILCQSRAAAPGGRLKLDL